MSRLDAVRDAAAHGGVTRYSSSGEVRLDCPFCAGRVGSGDRKRSLSANASKSVWHCHRCSAGGRGDLSFLGAAPASVQVKVVETLIRPPFFTALRSVRGSILSKPYEQFLAHRGLPVPVLDAAGVGFCDDGPVSGRVVVPILDGTDWQGFSARTIYAARPKYTYPPGMHRSELLYNVFALDRATDEPVYVVEGVLDALHLWPDAVALLGSASAWQVARLRACSRPLVVVLDGDAWRSGWELALRLSVPGRLAAALRLGPRVDPDEVPAAQLREAARDALAQEAARWT